MDIAQPGVIVFTDRYEACVDFYEHKVGLEILAQKEALTSFAFGSGYLMIETGGPPAEAEKHRDRNPTVLRFNVADVPGAAAELRSKGVDVEIREFGWGTIGVFLDPDGNRCELKDQA